MKKLYSLLIITLMASSVMAQDFVYATGQHRIDTVINENYESYQIEVVTPSPENITFKWELVSNSFDPAWSTAVCDYTNCYVGFPSSATMTAITSSEMAAGTYGFIKCNITCGLNYGDGKVEIYVYDASNYSRGDTVSFDIHWPAPSTGVGENALSISTYPNPVTDQLTVSNESPLEGELVIVNILGKVVYNKRMNAMTTDRIDFSSMSTGTYMVRLNSDDGTSVTKKVIKK